LDKNGNPTFTIAKDWRCTTKPGKLYISLFTWPGAQFELNKVKGTVGKAYMLADKSKALKVSQSGDKITVALPAKPTSEYASVLVLETK
jgi:alpha-L-fucosidase